MQFSWWYLFVSIPVIWSLWIGFRVFRGINKPSDFFWYPEGMSSEKLRDSLTASNISVGSAIFAFLSFGYSYKLAAFISPLTWLLGFFILYKVFPRIENSEKRTLHGFWPIVMIVDLSVISLLCYRSSDSWVPMV